MARFSRFADLSRVVRGAYLVADARSPFAQKSILPILKTRMWIDLARNNQPSTNPTPPPLKAPTDDEFKTFTSTPILTSKSVNPASTSATSISYKLPSETFSQPVATNPIVTAPPIVIPAQNIIPHPLPPASSSSSFGSIHSSIEVPIPSSKLIIEEKHNILGREESEKVSIPADGVRKVLEREEEQEQKVKRNEEKDQQQQQQQERRVYQALPETAKERTVPASRLSRLWHFGGLAAGLGIGALSESLRRSVGGSSNGSSSSAVVMTEANAERLAEALCRMRGAALKLGQMLSIQDESLLPKPITDALARVRGGADFMPTKQVEKVLVAELGPDWREKVREFDPRPIAAASIGQVHRVVLHDGREAVMKIQYPGVAESIDSDLNNLARLLNFSAVLPPGLHIEKAMSVARKELKWECDYRREADSQRRFKRLLADEPQFHIPAVIDSLSTERVLTSEMIYGMPVDKIAEQEKDVRQFVSRQMLQLTLRELFEFRFMQTDPNWNNFFFDSQTGKIQLLDFGACRDFEAQFTHEYLHVVKAAAEKDRATVLSSSQKMGFLTGDESNAMKEAHIDAVLILGEPFATNEPYDFERQNITARIHHLIPVMLRHRLTPPPEESYSLHRKLAGAFLLCSKLRATLNCKEIFDKIHAKQSKLI